MAKRPLIEALNDEGYPYIRPARVIAELPREAIASALGEATQALAAELGLPSLDDIKYGLPVGLAFMSRGDIRKHPLANLLRQLGDSLSLDHCPSYN